MKTLDFSAMENIQGGDSGSLNINLPLAGLVSVLNLGSILGLGLGLGLGISYSVSDLNLGSLGSLIPGL